MDLGPPPAHPDKQETPVGEEFWRLAFEGVSDELKSPSDEEQGHAVQPQAVVENAGDKNWGREQNDRNAQRMTHPIQRMLMTGTVLRDPLLVSTSAQHAEIITRS